MILYYTYNKAIFLHFQTFVHILYTISCVHMEVYFEAMRFVSILFDFSKNKMYTWGFNKGYART